MILPGGLITYFISSEIDTTFLLPFAAGNFIYIAASDLIPEIKHEKRLSKNLIHFAAFAGGVFVILITKWVFE
jgi:zinc and cadmium transporter